MDVKEVAVSPVESTTIIWIQYSQRLNLLYHGRKSNQYDHQKYVSKIQNDVEKLNKQESDKTNVVMYYDVKQIKTVFSAY